MKGAPIQPPVTNPYEHICDGRQRGHSCDACIWQEGYDGAVANQTRMFKLMEAMPNVNASPSSMPTTLDVTGTSGGKASTEVKR